MTSEEAQEAALNSLLLGLGSREDVKVCRRVNRAGTLAEFETRDGERFTVRVSVESSFKPKPQRR